jgi:hypothetical protein
MVGAPEYVWVRPGGSGDRPSCAEQPHPSLAVGAQVGIAAESRFFDSSLRTGRGTLKNVPCCFNRSAGCRLSGRRLQVCVDSGVSPQFEKGLSQSARIVGTRHVDDIFIRLYEPPHVGRVLANDGHKQAEDLEVAMSEAVADQCPPDTRAAGILGKTVAKPVMRLVSGRMMIGICPKGIRPRNLVECRNGVE